MNLIPLSPTGAIAVFTDGSANSQDRSGGWAWVAIDGFGGIETDCGAHKDTTNNQMELCAPAKALEELLKSFGPRTILVFSDSQYMIKGITDRTRKRNRNVSWWNRLDRAVDAHQCVEFEHVKGHTGNEFNEMADKLAVLARKAG